MNSPSPLSLDDFTGTPSQAAIMATFLLSFDALRYTTAPEHKDTAFHDYLIRSADTLMCFALGDARSDRQSDDVTHQARIATLLDSFNGGAPVHGPLLVGVKDLPDITNLLDTVLMTNPESFGFYHSDALTAEAGWTPEQRAAIQALACHEGVVEYGQCAHTLIRIR